MEIPGPHLEIPGSFLVDPLANTYLTLPPFYIQGKKGNARGARKANSRSHYGLTCLEEAEKKVRCGASGSKMGRNSTDHSSRVGFNRRPVRRAAKKHFRNFCDPLPQRIEGKQKAAVMTPVPKMGRILL